VSAGCAWARSVLGAPEARRTISVKDRLWLLFTLTTEMLPGGTAVAVSPSIYSGDPDYDWLPAVRRAALAVERRCCDAPGLGRVRPPKPLLTRAEVISSLNKYLDGSWTASDLTRWADDNEMAREYEQGYSEVIATFLFDFSSEELNGVLTPTRARKWFEDLLAAKYDEDD
jgi:hypothetical protein